MRTTDDHRELPPHWSRRIPKSLGDRTQIWPSAINPHSFARTASVNQIACLVIPDRQTNECPSQSLPRHQETL